MNSVLLSLIKRNIKKYLRDRASVFFSFLSVIVILMLYAIFLGKMQIDNLTDEMGNIVGIRWLVSSWIMSGILMVSTVTVPLGAIGGLIDDRSDQILDDFYVSPISRNTLALSYLVSTWVIAFFLLLLNLIIGQLFVFSQGGDFLTIVELIKTLLVMLFSIMTFSVFFFYISIFVKSRSAYGTLSITIGSFIGFLGGIYIPIGELGKSVQNVMNLLPTAHAVTLMRNVYMESAIERVFKNAPEGFYEEYANTYGLSVTIGNFEMQEWQMILSMGVFMLVFYGLSIWKLSKSKL